MTKRLSPGTVETGAGLPFPHKQGPARCLKGLPHGGNTGAHLPSGPCQVLPSLVATSPLAPILGKPAVEEKAAGRCQPSPQHASYTKPSASTLLITRCSQQARSVYFNDGQHLVLDHKVLPLMNPQTASKRPRDSKQ